MLFVPFGEPIRPKSDAIDDIFGLLLVLSTMHVGLTSYFYLDRDYRTYVAKHRGFYIFLPAAVILAAGSITSVFGSAGVIYLQLFYHAWLLFHYGRQNYGILAFTAIATKSARPRKAEKAALHLAPIGGILAAHGVFKPFQDSAFAAYGEASVAVGAALTAAAFALACIAIFGHVREKASIWRSLMLILLSLFYLPTFFFDTYTQAVLSYAIAHALQYFVFMSYLATGTKRVAPSRSIALLAVGALATWTIILSLREKAFWGPIMPFVTGAALGLVMWHFIMDAGLWRLSQQWQRDQVKERYRFLFES